MTATDGRLATGVVDQEIASELVEAIFQVENEAERGGGITAAIASWDRRILLIRSSMSPTERWVTLFEGTWTLPVAQAVVLGALAALGARDIQLDRNNGTIRWTR